MIVKYYLLQVFLVFIIRVFAITYLLLSDGFEHDEFSVTVRFGLLLGVAGFITVALVSALNFLHLMSAHRFWSFGIPLILYILCSLKYLHPNFFPEMEIYDIDLVLGISYFIPLLFNIYLLKKWSK